MVGSSRRAAGREGGRNAGGKRPAGRQRPCLVCGSAAASAARRAEVAGPTRLSPSGAGSGAVGKRCACARAEEPGGGSGAQARGGARARARRRLLVRAAPGAQPSGARSEPGQPPRDLRSLRAVREAVPGSTDSARALLHPLHGFVRLLRHPCCLLSARSRCLARRLLWGLCASAT